MSAYVKFMESAGARVVPLVYNEPLEVTLEKLSKLDGVLFPGGANSYLSYAKRIMSQVTKYNDEGIFFPVWGTCLGYETLMEIAASAGTGILESYSAHKISLPLEFLVPPEDT